MRVRSSRVHVRVAALVLGLVLPTAACSAGAPPESSPGVASAPTSTPLVATSSPGSGSAAASAAPSATSAILPSKDGAGVLVGVNLDWGSDSPAALAARLGRTPAAWVLFVGFPLSQADRDNVASAVRAIAAQHGILLLTLEPNGGLATVDDASVGDLVGAIRDANTEGVPVLVRFAHEMNGSWYAWGEQPTAYVAAFRRVANAVHAGASGAAMLWAPNDGGGYPFTGGRYEAKPGTKDFARLDTNGDGTLSMADDPYAPYYPGDDAVDWVGMSLYHWGDHWPWGRNVLPEADKFAAKLTGTYDGAAGDERALPDFYATYAVGHDKPVAIPETAAFYRPAAPQGPDELALKRAWWREVFSTATLERFPRIRLVDWFDQRKFETEVDDVVDWRVTAEPAIASAFLADLPAGFGFAASPR